MSRLIVVVGGGYAGLAAAGRLLRRTNRDHVTVVNSHG